MGEEALTSVGGAVFWNARHWFFHIENIESLATGASIEPVSQPSSARSEGFSVPTYIGYAMGKRKEVSPSLRWSVFARDGFTCRYCGKQAGQEGVELHADHVISVAEGGETTFDNLVTACQKCNGGKGARSLAEAPAAEDVIKRILSRSKTIRDQAKALTDAVTAKKELNQQIVNMKCAAYRVESTTFDNGEKTIMGRLCGEFGADIVLGWYQSAADHNCPESRAVRYVCGCAKKEREESGVRHG